MQILVHLRAIYGANPLNIGQQNGVTWEDMIDINFLIESLWLLLVCFRVFLPCEILKQWVPK